MFFSIQIDLDTENRLAPPAALLAPGSGAGGREAVGIGVSGATRRHAVTLGALAALAGATVAFETSSGAASVPVIIRAADGELDAARALALSLGGEFHHEVGIVNGFLGTMPRDRIDDLEAHREIIDVSPDSEVRLASSDGYDPSADVNSLLSVSEDINARHVWSRGGAGDGIGVAVIDTGVTPVDGLDTPGKVIHGPDLTPESSDPTMAHLDGYGHGTFMAGLIAANDLGIPVGKDTAKNTTDYLGVAPNAHIVSIKVGDRDGNTAVGSVILALDWVLQNAGDPGLNIRVVNLSFSTDSQQSYALDPLALAVERVWHAGVVVVTAAGNSGGTTGRMTMPAVDPYVIAVGANHTMGTRKTDDDEIPTFSSRGDGYRNPDFVAPGVSLQGLRVPESHVDQQFGSVAGFGGRFIRGSGTSQAAAIVSGAAAILLSRFPELTPDQVKVILIDSAKALRDADAQAQGAGLIDLDRAVKTKKPEKLVQKYLRSNGLGSIVLSGGSWSSPAWSGNRWSGNRWSGNRWSGSTWSGSTWSGSTWSGSTWSGSTWSGSTWSAAAWS